MTIQTMGLMIAFSMCILLSLLFSYLLVDKVFKSKRKPVISISLLVIWAILLTLSILYINNLPAVYAISFVGGVLLYGYLFKFNMYQSYLCSCFVVFHMIALKGVTIGVMSLVIKENSFMILQDQTLSMISIIISQVLNVIMMECYVKMVKIKEVRTFLLNKRQLIFTLICHLTITVFMLFNSFSFYYNLDLIWISVAQIMVGVLLYLIYMIILNYGIKTSDMIQHKLRDQQQLETIQAQMRQQNSLLKITEILNVFKHDYREHMLILEDHIANQRYQEALKEVKHDCLYHLSELPHTTKYSNNMIINSLMIDRQNICEMNHINMEAILFYPLDLSITEKEYHESIRILTENAIEANLKVKEEARYLKIKSMVDKQWLSIMIENPYEGVVFFENDMPISINNYDDASGMGIVYVEELIEEHQGVMHFDLDSEHKIFRVTLLIPINSGNEGDI